MKSPLKRFICALFVLAGLGLATPAAAQSGKWETVGTTDNVKVSRMEVEGSSVLAFRGETVANVHIGKIINTFIDGSQRKHWVDRYDDHKTLERTDSMEKYWIKFALPFPVSNRDYVLHTDVNFDEDKKVFTAKIKSIVDKRKPVDSCCVRAETFGTFYRFEAVPGEDKTKMIVEVHTDPKGMLPNWLINRIQKDWPSKTLSGLIKRSSIKDQKIFPRVANWHTIAPKPAPPVKVEKAVKLEEAPSDEQPAEGE
ncbi:MAG: hypothetical protein H0U74_07435 [Bradymonadaceae bacterium]|nr:hypothetical protein [Lujinxingiaceae bacterium]